MNSSPDGAMRDRPAAGAGFRGVPPASSHHLYATTGLGLMLAALRAPTRATAAGSGCGAVTATSL